MHATTNLHPRPGDKPEAVILQGSTSVVRLDGDPSIAGILGGVNQEMAAYLEALAAVCLAQAAEIRRLIAPRPAPPTHEEGKGCE